MRNFILLIALVSGVAMSVEYPESFDTVSEKYEVQGFESLSENEQIIYSVWWLEAEVNNGGFHQYFWNSAGDHAKVALSSLQKVGAQKTASLLEQAILISFDGNLPRSRAQRQNELEVNEDIKIEKLGELDSEFYEYSENFHQKINDYVRKKT